MLELVIIFIIDNIFKSFSVRLVLCSYMPWSIAYKLIGIWFTVTLNGKADNLHFGEAEIVWIFYLENEQTVDCFLK